MRFKSKIQVLQTFRYNQPFNADGILDEDWEFSRTRVHFTKEQERKFGKDITLDPNVVRWIDETPYFLQVNDIAPKYRVIIKEYFPVTLRLNSWNRIKMKWIHKLYWIQDDKSNWFKTPLIAGSLSIIGYFIGQSIGYNKGYEKGLSEGKAFVQKPVTNSIKVDSSKVRK